MSEAKKAELVLTESPSSDTGSLLAVIERAASSSSVDVDKMERLLNMHERILAKASETEFSAAMARVQAVLPTVARDAKNQQTSSMYARHEALAKAIKPLYTKEGFSITFSEGDSPKEKYIRIVGVLRHRSGHKETHHVDLPLDLAGIKGNVNKTETHATGSTLSYGRRYLTLLIFDIATGDDDDGNSASVEYISEEQAADLNALLEEVGANREAFCRYFKISKVDELPVQAYKQAIAMTEAKRKK